ncbi:hypothetical protein GCM10022237_20000 [Nocardioides ginsengisoli]|uniref:Aminoglycoside phosphotransferase domain-containing protein n=2 Tax=Nocardioides ginsengisoli TaxID=363868 RepID=A0ABW3W553_9ACTN
MTTAVSGLSELTELVGHALGRAVRLTPHLTAIPYGGLLLQVRDRVPAGAAPAGSPVALARWGVDDATSASILAEASVLAALSSRADRLVVPEVAALTTWHGRPLLVQEWRTAAGPVRAPGARERRAAERSIVALASPAELGRSYADGLRGELRELEHTGFADQLLATLDRLAERYDLDALPRGGCHGAWSSRTLAAGPGGSVLAWGWDRYRANRPVGFDALHHRLIELRGDSRSPDAGTALVAEAPRLLGRWHGRVVPEASCVARLLLLELAARELREVGPRGAPVSWLADWMAPTVFSA